MDSANSAIWESAFRERHIENSEPFAAKWDPIWPDIILWKNAPPRIPPPLRPPNYPDQQIYWE